MTKLLSLALRNPVLTAWILGIALAAIAGGVGYGVWYVMDLRHDNVVLKTERDAEKKRADDNQKALEAAQKSAAAQIKALEADRLDKTRRADKLSKQLLEIEATNEKFDCVLPDFMRRSLYGELR